MAKPLEQFIQEQLGGMVFQLAVKDTQLEQLREENEKLKSQLASHEEKKKAPEGK